MNEKTLSALLAGAILLLSACGAVSQSPAAPEHDPETAAASDNPDSQENVDSPTSLPENADSTIAPAVRQGGSSCQGGGTVPGHLLHVPPSAAIPLRANCTFYGNSQRNVNGHLRTDRDTAAACI